METLAIEIANATGSEVSEANYSPRGNEFVFYHRDLKIGGYDDNDDNNPSIFKDIVIKAVKCIGDRGYNYTIHSEEKGYWNILIKKN